jgi:hypothetical protein
MDLAIDEVEVDVPCDLSQNMIAADALIQTDTVVKQLLLEIWLAAHHGGAASLFCYLVSNKQIKECLSRLIRATARRNLTASYENFNYYVGNHPFVKSHPLNAEFCSVAKT